VPIKDASANRLADLLPSRPPCCASGQDGVPRCGSLTGRSQAENCFDRRRVWEGVLQALKMPAGHTDPLIFRSSRVSYGDFSAFPDGGGEAKDRVKRQPRALGCSVAACALMNLAGDQACFCGRPVFGRNAPSASKSIPRNIERSRSGGSSASAIDMVSVAFIPTSP